MFADVQLLIWLFVSF